MVAIKRAIRVRFGVRTLIAAVAVCAIELWAVRFSRDSHPAYLYADWLNSGDESVRVQAAQELGGVNEEGSPVTSSLIKAMLTDRSAAVREQSARSLGRLAAKRSTDSGDVAVQGLVHALEDKNVAVRVAVAEALGRVAPAPDLAVPALLHAANDESEWVHGATIAALGLIQKKAGVDRDDVRLALAAAMIDPSLHVRELGIYAFWATAENSPGCARVLLADDDVRVRRAAARALARSGPLAQKVEHELKDRLSDPDTEVRTAAANALENLPEDPAVGQESSSRLQP